MSSNFNTSGGVSSLSQLKDLDISSKNDGDFLQYDATAGKFKAKPLSLPQTVLGLRIADYPRLSSETDDTGRFQRAFTDLTAAGGGNLFIGAETLTVAPDTLSIPSNVNVEGLGSVSVINMTATGGTFFYITGASYIKVEHVKFTAPNSSILVFGVDVNSSDIALNNVVCENPWLISTINASYTDFTDESQLLKRLTIQNCILKGDGTASPPAMNISYCDGATVVGNNISFYGHGIQWWGGDSNPSTGQGAVSNPRWCRNLHIANNHVTDIIGGGGIWGSMGQYISITGNTIQRCGDVGIDLEGCFYATVQGNTVKDCDNGGITTFFYNRGIQIFGNVVTSSKTDLPVFRIYNSGYSVTTPQDNNDIAVFGNVFEGNGVLTKIYCDTVLNLVFTNNVCKNTKIFMSAGIQRSTFSENRIIFDVAAVSYVHFVELYCNIDKSTHIAKGNQILSLVTQPTSSIGLNFFEDNSISTSWVSSIEGNVINGFPTDLRVYGANAKAFYLIRGNILGTTISITGSPTVVSESNRKIDGTAI